MTISDLFTPTEMRLLADSDPGFVKRMFYGLEPSGFRVSNAYEYETARPTPRTCQNCGARQEVVRCSYCRKPV